MREGYEIFNKNFGISVKFRVEWYVDNGSTFVLHPFWLKLAFNAYAIIILVQTASKINCENPWDLVSLW